MYKKFIPCRRCKSDNKIIPDGYYKTKTPEGYDTVTECPHHIVWRENEYFYKKFVTCGFDKSKFELDYPASYVGNKSRSSAERIVNYINKFNENPKIRSAVLYLTGINGTQKTSIAQFIGREIIKLSYDAKYTTMKRLIDHLWNAQRNEASTEEVCKLSNCDLLIIDESFDKNKIHVWESGNQMGYLDSFLRTRINLNLGTIFISNKKPFEISKNGFTLDLQDLIVRETGLINSVLEFNDVYFDNKEVLPENIF